MTNEEAYNKGYMDAIKDIGNVMYINVFEKESDMVKWDSGCWIKFKMFRKSIDQLISIFENRRENINE